MSSVGDLRVWKQLALATTALMIAVAAGLFIYPSYQRWKLLKPYEMLVSTHAEEQDVLTKYGHPYVTVDPQGLQEWTENWKPWPSAPPNRAAKILVYYREKRIPILGGYVVYISLNRRGVVKHVALGLT